jgi:hypothetical protein
MSKLAWQPESAFSPRRPAGRLLILAVAVALVWLSAPWTVLPLVQLWRQPEPAPAAVEEAWPEAPATYVPPTVVAPAPLRSVPTTPSLPPPVWRELSYLTTVEFTINSVVETERRTSVAWLGEMVTDRLLMRAVGKVQVGIDLAQVREVEIDGSRIQFVAPQPVVTSVELLPEESRIYDQEQIVFLSQAAGMETEALEKARQQLRREVAENESMMKLAQQFARLQLTEFLRKAGFTEVEVSFAVEELD